MLCISMILMSCEKSGVVDSATIEGDVTFLFDEIKTKASGSSFDLNDVISTNAYSGSDHMKYTTYTYDGSGTFTSDSPITYDGITTTEYSYTAIYPEVGELGSKFSFTVSTNQSTTESVELSDLLIATVASTSSLTPELTFYHTMSRLIFNVTISRDGVTSSDTPTITLHAQTTAACDILNGSYAGSGDIIDITPYNSGSSYSTIIAPQSFSAQSVIATMSVDGKSFEFKRELETICKSGEYLSYDWEVDIVTEAQTITPVGGLIQDWENGADDSDDGGNDDDTGSAFTVTTNLLSDRSVVVGWSTISSGDGVFDIELLKGSETTRSYSSMSISSSDTAQYTANGWRFVFAGLDPSTSYTAKITRGTEIGTVAFSTTASPDESGYLKCVDFDEHWWGGYPQYSAFGIDYSDSSIYQPPTSSVPSEFKNFPSSPNTYVKTYFDQWETDLLNTSYMQNVSLGAGIVKIGATGESGQIVLPQISESTDIVLTFDSAPYVEPNATTGSIESSVAVLEGVTFSVLVYDNTQLRSTVYLTNNTPTECQADATGYISMTPQSIIITGASSSTFIYVCTNSTSPRMWLDNIKIAKQ